MTDRSKPEERAKASADRQIQAARLRADRLLLKLAVCQWIGATLACLVLYQWVWTAAAWGGALTVATVGLVQAKPGTVVTRHAVAAFQMLWAALIIHIVGGRIEAHFLVIASLAVIAQYRDWRVLVTAIGITVSDHVLRGIHLPHAIYGTAEGASWRTVEHMAWILAASVVIARSVGWAQRDALESGAREATLEAKKDFVEQHMGERAIRLERHNENLRMEVSRRERKVRRVSVERDAAQRALHHKARFIVRLRTKLSSPIEEINRSTQRLMSGPLSADQYQTVTSIQGSVLVLVTVIKDLLELSRVEAVTLTDDDDSDDDDDIEARITV